MFSTWHRPDRVVFDLDEVGADVPAITPTVEHAEDRPTRSQLAAHAADLARQLHELSAELARSD